MEENTTNQGSQAPNQNNTAKKTTDNNNDNIVGASHSSGGENRVEQEDQYTEDLRQSGDRNSSNSKEGS